MKNIFIKIFALLLYITALFAQPDSTFPMKTCPFDLVYDITNKTIDSSNIHKPACSNPTTIYGVKKVLSLNDTNLMIRKNSKSIKINVKDVRTVKFYEGNKFVFGLIGGAIMGLSIVIEAYNKSTEEDPSNNKYFAEALEIGLIVAIPFAIIGAVYGLSVDDTHSYNLSSLATEKKAAKLIKLFRKYKNNIK
jgi:hypothetical protein